MSLDIPGAMLTRIKEELLTLPEVWGKVTLQITFNCTSSKAVGSMKIQKSVEEEVRP